MKSANDAYPQLYSGSRTHPARCCNRCFVHGLVHEDAAPHHTAQSGVSIIGIGGGRAVTAGAVGVREGLVAGGIADVTSKGFVGMPELKLARLIAPGLHPWRKGGKVFHLQQSRHPGAAIVGHAATPTCLHTSGGALRQWSPIGY